MFNPLVQTQTPRPVNTSARRRRARLAGVAALTVAALAALSPARAHAETQAPTFEFGPDTNRPARSDASVTLTVPARTLVKVSGIVNTVPGFPIPVVVEVFQPGGTSPVASMPWVPSPLPFGFLAEGFTGGFISQVGCPGSWTVRVRTANNAVPSRGIYGTITFDFQKPARVNLDMVGDPVRVAIGGEKKVALAGHDTLGVANGTLIAGRGQFRIKAKWDTDPGDVWHFGRFYKLRVALLRPDGTVAETQIAFSQHRPDGEDNDDFTKVNFIYNVTQADAAMTGSWKVRIRNTVNGGRVKIVNFDVENLAFPSFNSTFQAQCN